MKKRISLLKILLISLCLPALFIFTAPGVASAEENIIINGQTVDISSFCTYSGASIRYDTENKGIRFITGISETVYDRINQIVADSEGYYVKYGTIVTYSSRARKCLDAGLDFTKEALDQTIQTAGSKYMDFDTKVFRTTAQVSGNKEYTAVLGISEANYAKPLTARGYMVIGNGSEEVIYYADYEILNSTAENISHTLLENFKAYGVDSDAELSAIAEYTKNEQDDGYFIDNGCAMLTVTGNEANASVEYNQSVGGRSDAIKYTLLNASASWGERIESSFNSPTLTWSGAGAAGHVHAVNRQNAMGFNYVLFDVYIKDSFSIYYPTANRTHAIAKISANGDIIYQEKDTTGSYAVTTDTAYTDCVKVFNEGGTRLTATYSGMWYVIAVDISCNIGLGYNSSVDTAFTVTTANASIYFDNVRYYRTDEWQTDIVQNYVEKDGSEFGIMFNGGEATQNTGTVAGRENVEIFKEDSPTTKSRAGFLFTRLWDDANATNATLANKRIAASGVNYISFDVCRVGSSNFIMYSWNGSAYSAFKVAYNTGAVTSPANVKLFDSEGNAATVMTANEWYTMVIEVKYRSGSQWSSIQWESAWTNLGIDNITYYYNTVPALWNK